MKLNVEYAENIIIAVKFKGEFTWFVTEKDYWYLDLVKWENAFIDKGHAIFNQGDYSDRFDIPILDEKSADAFLCEISEYKASKEELSELILAIDLNDTKMKYAIMNLIPCLFIDFDEKLLMSQFPEPASFEEYVPKDWKGSYENFLNKIPSQEKYWILDGKDIFKL
ncbi:hypothetical protein [Paenibacillus bovis]|uniref:Group-specific protein n=1 Tax=Paenibacillus bovis TaxID=1616788 RepID=A0A172ZIX3_9BACL|nr:hypothetical protein [Paenibacillus bovis]ANF97581.1 hypothetical protein AR543_17250 [Paenibacillus bovis]